MEKKDGFTLIELLVVIIILGILAAIAIPRFTGSVESARSSESMSFMSHVREQLIVWASTHSGTYTDNFSSLGFETGGGVILDAGNTTATLKYWTVTIDSGTGTITADRTGKPDASDAVTLTIDGVWGGDYWGAAGHPPIPSA